ncbi:MAG: D-alanyl-D-alanine carboxypeptidase [Clostridia bacterium]|nr:D-alanyl-D-alanine carboxypeptidase [Clostridia bacterium]
MAELIAGSEENFVQMMNEKAKTLGLEHTHFMNAHGIDEDNHYSSAKDIAIMSRELVTKHPNILKYTSIWMDSIRGGTFELSNTNKLLKTYSGITGLKTGSTSKALFNLTATATRDNMSLIAVVLTAPSGDIRGNEITQLLNYGFSNYQVKTYAKKGDTISTLNINKAINSKVKIVFENDVTQILEKGTSIEVSQEVILNENICAPLKANDAVGKVIFKDKDGTEIFQVNAIVTADIPRSNLIDYLRHTFNSYLMVNFK